MFDLGSRRRWSGLGGTALFRRSLVQEPAEAGITGAEQGAAGQGASRAEGVGHRCVRGFGVRSSGQPPSLRTLGGVPFPVSSRWVRVWRQVSRDGGGWWG
jgi:hypothetical protein